MTRYTYEITHQEVCGIYVGVRGVRIKTLESSNAPARNYPTAQLAARAANDELHQLLNKQERIVADLRYVCDELTRRIDDECTKQTPDNLSLKIADTHADVAANSYIFFVYMDDCTIHVNKFERCSRENPVGVEVLPGVFTWDANAKDRSGVWFYDEQSALRYAAEWREKERALSEAIIKKHMRIYNNLSIKVDFSEESGT